MKITALIENNTGNPACVAQHGLSFYFETQKHRVLVDTGADESFLKNAEILGIDLKKVDICVLSHGHYDHGGGIMAFSRLNPDAVIYLQSGAFGEFYSEAEDGTRRYIGMDQAAASLPQVIKIDGDLEIDEELSLFSKVTGRRGFSRSNLRLKEVVDGVCQQASFQDEQYLVVKQEGKQYLFSGCAHNGILNILDRYQELYGRWPDVVFSGFHYMKKTAYTPEEIQIITDTAGELAEKGTLFYTCHCTGAAAYELMKPLMGRRLHSIQSGETAELYRISKAAPDFLKKCSDKKISVTVPGSKSITNRALLLAAMANGKSTLKGCLTSDDAAHFLDCIRKLGFPVEVVSDGQLGEDITITGYGGDIPNKRAELYVGSAGTAARFLAAMLAFSEGDYILQSSEQMKKRPMQPLIDTLRSAGACVECLEKEGYFPLHIVGVPQKADIPSVLTVNIDKSSQFLSALLIAAGTFGKPVEIRVNGSHGLSYVDLTADMMKSFGVTVCKEQQKKAEICRQDAQEDRAWTGQTESGQGETGQMKIGQGETGQTKIGQGETGQTESRQEQAGVVYRLSGNGTYHPLSYDVEPDMSAAAYFYALAAILGTTVCVKGVTDHMLQGDTRFLELLEQMGCHIDRGQMQTADSDQNEGRLQDIVLTGPDRGCLKGGFTIDMSAFSDQALTLAAIAPFADAPISITGIGHIRLQECDRIHAIADNLSAMGIRVDEKEDAVTIYPGQPSGCDVETYDDHRVAMAFALTGLRTEGLYIENPSCCKKTFAQYFEVLKDALNQLK